MSERATAPKGGGATTVPATAGGPSESGLSDNGGSLATRILQSNQPWMLYISFVGLTIAFSIASPVFASGDNFLNIGRQTALVSIIAVGMTLVIVAAEIDLSVASVLALSGMMAALAMQEVSNSWLIGAAAALLVGGLVGLINGTLTTRLAVPSFLVTLGMLGIARGIALVLTDTEPVIITNQTYYTVFGEGYYFGIPAPIAWTIIVAAIGIVLLHFTTFGRKVYAVGGNPTAARYSGINTARVRTVAFVITGMLAGLAALVFSARAHAARPDVAQGLELDVITAVILGGTRLFGGSGTIVGTIMGSILIGILNNGLVLVGVSSSWQLAVKGAIIIAAVAFGRK